MQNTTATIIIRFPPAPSQRRLHEIEKLVDVFAEALEHEEGEIVERLIHIELDVRT